MTRSYNFIQPRHTLAPDPETGKDGHIFLPSSLTVAAARLTEMGQKVRIIDGNLTPDVIGAIEGSMIGINIVGPPLIPEVRALCQKIRGEVGTKAQIVLGGQTVTSLSDEQFSKLFGADIVKGDRDDRQKQAFKLWKGSLPPEEKVSLIPVYESFSREHMEKYLQHEFSLYLSQGCKFGCTFCAAKRSKVDPMTGKASVVTEVYRDLNLVVKDLRYLVMKAQSFGINEISMYLSNLDLLQTPEKMYEFAKRVNKIKADFPGFNFRFRGLCTVAAFMETYRKQPEILEECCKAGLSIVGFGVDGIAPEVWKSIKKGHNNIDDSIEAIKIAKQFGITPEILMVFGHAADTSATMRQALDFLNLMVNQYGAVPRPYAAKDLLPGNSGWTDPHNKNRVETLIHHPESFYALDVCARPSSISHPDRERRSLVSTMFEEAIQIPGCVTGAIDAITHEMSQEMQQATKRKNEGCYDR